MSFNISKKDNLENDLNTTGESLDDLSIDFGEALKGGRDTGK